MCLESRGERVKVRCGPCFLLFWHAMGYQRLITTDAPTMCFVTQLYSNLGWTATAALPLTSSRTPKQVADNPGTQQHLPVVREKARQSSQTSEKAGCPGSSRRILWGPAWGPLFMGLAGPAALCSAGRAAGPRTQCSRNPAQHRVGSASTLQTTSTPKLKPCQVFPYPVMTLAVSPSVCQPM